MNVGLTVGEETQAADNLSQSCGLVEFGLVVRKLMVGLSDGPLRWRVKFPQAKDLAALRGFGSGV
jgi:hypothetical protein